MKTLLALLLVVGLGGCKKKPAEPVEPEPVEQTVDKPEEPAKRPAPSVEQLRGLARRLAVKDPEPDCATLDAELEFEPMTAFIYVVKTVQQPPWSPMRAAGCLIELYPDEAHNVIVSWMNNENTEGLGRLVLAKLGQLPDKTAIAAVKSGLRGTLADATREAAAADSRAEVQTLAVPAE